MLRKKPKQTNKTKQKNRSLLLLTYHLEKSPRFWYMPSRTTSKGMGRVLSNLVGPEFGTYEKSLGTESRNYARIKLINYSLLSRTFPKHPSISRVVNIPQTEIYLEETPLAKWNFTVTGKIAQMRDLPGVFV